MLTINAPIFDLQGSLLINRPEVPGISSYTRRVNRAATLDGQSSISDFGFTDSDRTLEVRWRPTESEYESAVRLLKTYRSLIVSTSSGCFLCSPSEISNDNQTAQIALLVERKLSA